MVGFPFLCLWQDAVTCVRLTQLWTDRHRYLPFGQHHDAELGCTYASSPSYAASSLSLHPGPFTDHHWRRLSRHQGGECKPKPLTCYVYGHSLSISGALNSDMALIRQCAELDQHRRAQHHLPRRHRHRVRLAGPVRRARELQPGVLPSTAQY